MPQIVRDVRHNYGRILDHACGPSCSCRTRSGPARKVDDASVRRAVNASVTKVMRGTTNAARTADAARAGTARLSESLDALLPKIHAFVDRRREIRDAQRAAEAQPAGSVSATAGYVRDAAGNRTRSMTPADMQAMADAYYGKGKASVPAATDTTPTSRRPTTGADLNAIHAAYYRRA